MPAWKRALLQGMVRGLAGHYPVVLPFVRLPTRCIPAGRRQDQKRYDAEAPAREAAAREAEQQAKFNALPAWKQKLLMERQ